MPRSPSLSAQTRTRSTPSARMLAALSMPLALSMRFFDNVLAVTRARSDEVAEWGDSEVDPDTACANVADVSCYYTDFSSARNFKTEIDLEIHDDAPPNILRDFGNLTSAWKAQKHPNSLAERSALAYVLDDDSLPECRRVTGTYAILKPTEFVVSPRLIINFQMTPLHSSSLGIGLVFRYQPSVPGFRTLPHYYLYRWGVTDRGACEGIYMHDDSGLQSLLEETGATTPRSKTTYDVSIYIDDDSIEVERDGLTVARAYVEPGGLRLSWGSTGFFCAGASAANELSVSDPEEGPLQPDDYCLFGRFTTVDYAHATRTYSTTPDTSGPPLLRPEHIEDLKADILGVDPTQPLSRAYVFEGERQLFRALPLADVEAGTADPKRFYEMQGDDHSDGSVCLPTAIRQPMALRITSKGFLELTAARVTVSLDDGSGNLIDYLVPAESSSSAIKQWNPDVDAQGIDEDSAVMHLMPNWARGPGDERCLHFGFSRVPGAPEGALAVSTDYAGCESNSPGKCGWYAPQLDELGRFSHLRPPLLRIDQPEPDEYMVVGKKALNVLVHGEGFAEVPKLGMKIQACTADGEPLDPNDEGGSGNADDPSYAEFKVHEKLSPEHHHIWQSRSFDSVANDVLVDPKWHVGYNRLTVFLTEDPLVSVSVVVQIECPICQHVTKQGGSGDTCNWRCLDRDFCEEPRCLGEIACSERLFGWKDNRCQRFAEDHPSGCLREAGCAGFKEWSMCTEESVGLVPLLDEGCVSNKCQRNCAPHDKVKEYTNGLSDICATHGHNDPPSGGEGCQGAMRCTEGGACLMRETDPPTAPPTEPPTEPPTAPPPPPPFNAVVYPPPAPLINTQKGCLECAESFGEPGSNQWCQCCAYNCFNLRDACVQKNGFCSTRCVEEDKSRFCWWKAYGDRPRAPTPMAFVPSPPTNPPVVYDTLAPSVHLHPPPPQPAPPPPPPTKKKSPPPPPPPPLSQTELSNTESDIIDQDHDGDGGGLDAGSTFALVLVFGILFLACFIIFWRRRKRRRKIEYIE